MLREILFYKTGRRQEQSPCPAFYGECCGGVGYEIRVCYFGLRQVRHAMACGVRAAETQYSDKWRVMIDPAVIRFVLRSWDEAHRMILRV